MNILFICNQNKHRSKTAEEIFKHQFNTASAGLYNERPVTLKQLTWADLIIVMEEHQRKELSLRFPKIYLSKRILCLDIPDIYHYQQHELITLLQSRIHEALEPFLKLV